MTGANTHYATVWEAIADRLPDRPALRHGDHEISWSTFEERSARLAGALTARGIGRGDGVAAYLYNCPEYLEIFFAALKERAVPSNVNYRYGSDELLALLESSGAKVLFFDAALRANVATVAEQAPSILLVEIGADDDRPPVPGAVAYEDLVGGADPAPRIERAATDTWLSYTGGTTGLPKGVIFDIGQSFANSLRFRDLFLGSTTDLAPVDFAVQLTEQGAPLSGIPASPLMHSTGFFYAALPTLVAGGTVTTLQQRGFDAVELLDTIESCRASVVAIVGDAFGLPIARALEAGRPDGSAYDVSSLRTICSAGVAWTAPIKERMLEHLPARAAGSGSGGVTLVDSCGSTEGVAYGFKQVRRGDAVVTANFMAAAGLKVLDEDGHELPLGEVGLLAGPTTATGYLHDPERTAATFRLIDGVQHAVPGDLGRLEADGSLTLIGRGVTTINTGGEKVYPGEVEDAIRELAAVDDCLVLGVADERFGQAVAALVVPRPEAVVAADDVQGAVRRSLAGYKVPRHLRFVDAVPRLPNGKIDYEAAVLAVTATPASTEGH